MTTYDSIRKFDPFFVGSDVFAAAQYSFNCSGNEIYKNGKQMQERKFI